MIAAAFRCAVTIVPVAPDTATWESAHSDFYFTR